MTGCAAESENSALCASAPADDVAGELDDGDLHPEADAEIGHAVSRGRTAPRGSCPRCRGRRSRRAPARRRSRRARSPTFSAVSVSESTHSICTCASFAVPAVEQRLRHAQICVVQAAYTCRPGQSSRTCARRGSSVHHARVHSAMIRLARAETRASGRRRRPEPLLLQQQRHLIERGRRDVRDDAVLGRRCRTGRSCWRMSSVMGPSAAADEDVRLDAEGQQLLHGVLRGLALELAAAGDGDDEGNVDIQYISLRPCSAATCRMASRKGWLSMSPTVPPISVMTTSASGRHPWRRCGS